MNNRSAVISATAKRVMMSAYMLMILILILAA